MNNNYPKAYKEVLEIIKFFPEEEYNKIPKEKIDFFKQNMDKTYEFSIDPQIDLSKQNISKETNAIIVNLFLDYFATENQKLKINKILESNEQKLEQEKREKYNPDDIFKKGNNNIESTNIDASENNTNTSLIEYKESFFTRFKNFIFKILHIK